MIFLRSIVATLALATGPVLACPTVCAVKQTVAVVPVVQTLVATPLYIPTYGASYQYQQTSGSTDDLLRQLLEEIRGMRAEMKAMQANVPGASTAGGKAIVEASCIQCHQPAYSAKKGGGFNIVDQDGNLTPFSDRDKARINTRVALAKNMPPGKPLPDSQARAVVDFLTSQQAPQQPVEKAPAPIPAPLPPSLQPKEQGPMPKPEK